MVAQHTPSPPPFDGGITEAHNAPPPGMAWRHVVIGTKNSWLPRDPRGFRSKDHDMHSTGDHKNPPPRGEHAGLHRYARRVSGSAVIIPRELREAIGRAILAELHKRGLRVLALAVAGEHVHMQVELPDDQERMRFIIGRAKTAACYAVREKMPGTIWARYGSYKRINNSRYQRAVYGYVLRQKDAWTWSFRDQNPAACRRRA